jgi:GntR family transcriptional regulator
MVDKNTQMPLHLQIQEALTDEIRRGTYRVGEQIPSESQLVDHYGVSRTTVRKALDALVSRGVVVRQRGKGTFVARAIPAYGISTMASFSRQFVRLGYKVASKVLRLEVIPGSEYVCGKLGLPPGSDVLLIGRLRMVDGQPAAIHVSYLDNQTFGELARRDWERESLMELMEEVCGRPLGSASDTIRAVEASPEESRLLLGRERMPLLELLGVVFDQMGTPVCFTRALYPTDAFELTLSSTPERAPSLSMASEQHWPARERLPE